MSIDRSLRSKATLARHRNVLSRPERVAILQQQERWGEDASPLGLPKVGHRKAKAGKKKAEKAEAAAEAAPADAKAAAKPAAKGK